MPVNKPGQDQPIGSDAELTVINAVNQYIAESRESERKRRLEKSKRNWNLYLGIQDFGYKQDGQSQEFIPKTAEAVEQFVGFIEKALGKFEDWYRLDIPKDIPVEAASLMKVLDFYLNRIPSSFTNSPQSVKFSQVAGDLVKSGLLRSLMICKIHGTNVTRPKAMMEAGQFRLDPETGQLVENPPSISIQDEDEWRLAIDLVSDEDYFPDPTGARLYEIHEVRRDLFHLERMAEQGLYDEKVVEMIQEDFHRREEEEMKSRRGDDNAKPGFRKQVVIRECWGSLLNAEGRIAESNVVTAVANEKWLIRPPEPNPNWHGESPFEAGPLVRVPHSVWHKAMYDHAGPLNEALNELFNLMLDGSIGAVWGTRQVRTDWLENPADIQDGIPQNATLEVNSQCPVNGKVVENVAQGEVPRDAMNMYGVLNQEFNASAHTNEISLGGLPGKSVKATEVVQSSQSQAVTLDGIITDIEHFLSRVISKSWKTILQQAPPLLNLEILRDIKTRDALMLARLSPEERFALFGEPGDFKVTGVTSAMSKARDFQRLMALLQTVQSSPLLLQAAVRRYSPEKLLSIAEKQLNLTPSELIRTNDEQRTLPTDEARIMALFSQMMGQNGTNGANAIQADRAGNASMQSEVNQNASPTEL